MNIPPSGNTSQPEILPSEPEQMRKDLLAFCRDLTEIQFDRWPYENWHALAEQSKQTQVAGCRPQFESVDNHKKAAVDEIRLAQATAKPLQRNGEPVFFHCNTLTLGNSQFDCHQLPTDYSRDDVWLALWEDAGQELGKATIMKLSTARCPESNDLPVIRDYWPASTGNSGDKSFMERCLQAEEKLENIENSRKVTGLHEAIALRGGNAKIQEQQLQTLLGAAQAHLAYVQQEREAAEKGSGPAAFNGSLTTVDGITVEHMDESAVSGLPGGMIRRFKLSKAGDPQPRFATQIDYPYWADFTPSNAEVLPCLRAVYLAEHKGASTPLKVHCRAGVGRTGTFAVFCGAMDLIEEACQNGTIKDLNAKDMVFKLILSARSQRDNQMVQSLQQAQQILQALHAETLKIANKI